MDSLLPNHLSAVCGDLVKLNRIHSGNMPGTLGISITVIGPDFISARMPVNENTRQPMGILHGGASVTLAESLGSLASWFIMLRTPGARVAGIEVSASHLKAVADGYVTATCRPLRLGRTLHFWVIDIRDGKGDLCCSARLTVAVSQPRESSGTH